MQLKTHTCLLIDDDPDDAEMTLYHLGKLKEFAFQHIDDGEKALRFLFHPDSALPSIILLDIRMPVVDGIEILGRLKLHPILKSIPVIALISSVDGKKYVESFGVCPDGYLMKPVDIKSFLTVIAAVGISNLDFQRFDFLSRK
jgi:two-component system, response regulator